MGAAVLTAPRFQREQQVSFLGGSGTIKSYEAEAGMWTYLIQMEMGPEPTFGRVGGETEILLAEVDIN